MQKINKQLATVVVLLFAALVAACPLVACTALQNTAQQMEEGGSAHACCPKAPKPVHHQTIPSSDCPLLMTEFRAGLLKDKVQPVLPVLMASPPLARLPIALARSAEGSLLQHFAPDESDLYTRLHVLRI